MRLSTEEAVKATRLQVRIGGEAAFHGNMPQVVMLRTEERPKTNLHNFLLKVSLHPNPIRRIFLPPEDVRGHGFGFKCQGFDTDSFLTLEVTSCKSLPSKILYTRLQF